MPLDDIPEVPPYPRRHCVDLHPFLEVFSAPGHDHDAQDTVEIFGATPDAAVPERSPIPERHEVALSSFTEVSTPIPDMDAGSQAMRIPVSPEYDGADTHTTGTTSISTRREQVELESKRSQKPIPLSKPKFFERIKGFLSSKKPSPIDFAENIGSTHVEPHDIQEGGTIQIYPPPIAVDPPKRKAASTAIDSLFSLLKSLEEFNKMVDGIAEIHPYAIAAWSILNFASKIIDPKNLDAAVCSLLSKMDEVYVTLTKAELRDIEYMKEVVEHISQQTLECSYFIREYTGNEKFRMRFLKNLVSGTEHVEAYNNVFDELRQQFLDRAAGDSLLVVHRIWKGVEQLSEDLEGLVPDVDLNSMQYVSRAGLNTQKTCLDGTRREILDEITAWVNSTEENTPRVFWLHGNAGTGKSFISHTIANRFKKIGRLGSCVSFDRNEMPQQQDNKIFSTIARDLADRDEHMRKALMSAVRRDISFENTTDILQQWREMFLKPVQELSEGMAGPIVIIIDALDDSRNNNLLRILAGKVDDKESHIAKLPSHIRILVTSRPMPDIYTAFHRVEHVQQKSMDSIPRLLSERDIFQFISLELSDVEEINDEDAFAVMRASDGLFEWARLACAFIRGINGTGATTRKRFDIVVASNKDGHVGLLDSMYKLTLTSIFPEDGIIPRSVRLTLFRSVMAQIIGTKEPLPLASLKSMRGHFHNKNLQDIAIDIDVIVKPLGALLSGTTNSGPIRPLHASFPEYLSDQNRSGEFFTDVSGIHDELAFACLGVMKAELRFNICRLPSSYLPNSEVLDLSERIQENITPQLSYSCRFWANHLCYTSFNSPLAKGIRDFFNDERLLFWIEVLGLEKKISICTSLLSSVIEWSMLQSECKDICDDAADAQKFIRTFGGAISLSTPHLYMSALPFSPRNSSISMKFGERSGKVLRIDRGWNKEWPVIQRVLEGLRDSVLFVAFSPDGMRIVSGSGDRTIRLWDAETGEQLRSLEGHQDSVWSVGFSPDGRHIVSGSRDRTIRLWDAKTGEPLRPPLEGHQGLVVSVAFSPDGKRIVSGSEDKTIRLWDATTGKEVRPPLEGHQYSVDSVAFSPDGKRIVSGSMDKTIRLWDAKTGEQLQPPLEGHQNFVTSVAFSPDGEHIVSGSRDKTIRLWDAETGEQLRPPLKGHQNTIWSVGFSQDGKRIVSGSEDKTIRLWDAETGQQLRPPPLEHRDSVYSVGFSPDGRRIVSGSFDKTIRLWDAETGEQLRQDRYSVGSVAFSPDGKRIVSGSEDKTIRLWDAKTGKQLRTPLEGHQYSVNSVAFSPDGKLIVSGSTDYTICLWNAETGEPLRPPLEGHQDLVVCVAFSPDGKRIVSGSEDKTIRLWDAKTGEQLQPPLEGHQDSVTSVAFSPDGEHIVSGSEDKTIRLWDAETGKQLRPPLEGHQYSVDSVGFSPDGRQIVSGSRDRTIRLWYAETGEPLRPPLEGHQGLGVCVAVSPDGKRIVSGSGDRTIRLWDAETGEQLRSLEGHQDSVWSVGFSPDGQQIVSGSRDRTIRLWDAKTGEPLRPPLEGHQGLVVSVAFSPDGKRIVSGSEDKTIRLWDANTGLHLKRPRHSICFSSQLAHGLFEPVELFNQISSSSRTGLVDVSSGWVRIGPMSSLLFWSPPTYHPQWFSPDTQMIIPDPDVQLDLSNMAHGSSWHLCYNPQYSKM